MLCLYRSARQQHILLAPVLDGLISVGQQETVAIAASSNRVEKQQGLGCSTATDLAVLQQPVGLPCVHQRSLHTSSTCMTWQNFQRSLRQQMPKAKVFNVTNWKAWHESGLDIGLAAQLLAQLELPSQDKLSSTTQALNTLLENASSIEQLELAASSLKEHLTPSATVRLWAKAVSLFEQERNAGSVSLVPAGIVKQRTSSLIASTMHLVVNSIHQLSNTELQSLMYCLACEKPAGCAELQTAVAKVVCNNEAARLSSFKSSELSGVLLSAAMLRWHKQQQPAWSVLCSATVPHLRNKIQPKHVAQVLHALCIAGDTSSGLWHEVSRLVASRAASWAKTDIASVTDMQYTLARAGVQIPSSETDSDSQTSQSRQLQGSNSENPSSQTGSHAIVRQPQSNGILSDELLSLILGNLGQSPRAMARLAYALAVNLAYAEQHKVESVNVRHTLENVLLKATTNILSFPLSDLATLLEGYQQCANTIQQDRLIQLSTQVLQSRGMQGTASVDASIRTLNALNSMERYQSHAREAARELTGRAVKLVPVLPASDIARLMDCWAGIQDTPSLQWLLSVCARRLLDQVEMANSMAGNKTLPSHMVAPLLQAFVALGQPIAAGQKVPEIYATKIAVLLASCPDIKQQARVPKPLMRQAVQLLSSPIYKNHSLAQKLK